MCREFYQHLCLTCLLALPYSAQQPIDNSGIFLQGHFTVLAPTCPMLDSTSIKMHNPFYQLSTRDSHHGCLQNSLNGDEEQHILGGLESRWTDLPGETFQIRRWSLGKTTLRRAGIFASFLLPTFVKGSETTQSHLEKNQSSETR